MAEEKIKLSIIILSWNTKALLRQCLRSLRQDSKDKTPKEIIVVDNGSTDGSLQMVRKEFPQVRLIQNKENLGFAKGNNQGIKVAKGKYIMLLNSDTVIKKGAIGKLADFLDCHPEVGMVGPRLLNLDGSAQANCGRFPNLPVAVVMLFGEHWGGSDYVRGSPLTSGIVDWLMGAAFMARKEVFEEVGGLDEELFMYMEEVEWFYRARKVGFRAFFLKEAEIVHLGRGSAKQGKKDPILNIYRGLLHYYKKHKEGRELLTLRIMLKLKALLALIIGYLKNDNYLKETYGEAFKIN
jgi:hypothetical protein